MSWNLDDRRGIVVICNQFWVWVNALLEFAILTWAMRLLTSNKTGASAWNPEAIAEKIGGTLEWAC